jgi:hypothetical protein
VVSSLQAFHENCLCLSHRSQACYILPQFILLDLFILITFVEQYELLSSSLCSFLHPDVISHSWEESDILLKTLFSNALTVCSSDDVKYHVSHPYGTTGKI